MKKRLFFSTFCFFIAFFPLYLSSQECSVNNTSFKAGEKLQYDIFYFLAGFWVSAGEVEFSVNSINNNHKNYLQYYATGKTLPKYDWFYKVRDVYEAVVDAENLLPLAFRREVNEGNTFIKEKYYFDAKNKRSYTTRQMDDDEENVKDTVYYSACSWDVLSIIYYARNIDFSKSKKGERIPIKIFLDNQEHQSFIEYLGKEELEFYGKNILCHTFSPLLIEGTIFNSGKGMKVWVSTDGNMLPLLVETPILVGSIKAKLHSVENLRNASNIEFSVGKE